MATSPLAQALMFIGVSVDCRCCCLSDFYLQVLTFISLYKCFFFVAFFFLPAITDADIYWLVHLQLLMFIGFSMFICLSLLV